MRNPKRIPRILKLIEKYWTKHPDYRFGQMLINLGIAPDDPLFWNMDDDELEKGLKQVFKEGAKKK